MIVQNINLDLQNLSNLLPGWDIVIKYFHKINST